MREPRDLRSFVLALRVCETYLSTIESYPSEFAHESKPYAFVYLSAEDMGRPVIPRRYIETKQQAERGIKELCQGTDVRGIFIRPSKQSFGHFILRIYIFTYFHRL